MTARAVSLNACCERIGMSRRTAERALADGTFPVPHLPRRGRRGAPYRFSTYDIDTYLQTAATADARVNSHRAGSSRAAHGARRATGSRRSESPSPALRSGRADQGRTPRASALAAPSGTAARA
jgi:predicted DNA-binding transcriptional regulator AlpA